MTKLPPISNDEHAPRFQSEVWTRFAAAARIALGDTSSEYVGLLADSDYAEWLKRVEA